jgi:hypothetical protein
MPLEEEQLLKMTIFQFNSLQFTILQFYNIFSGKYSSIPITSSKQRMEDRKPGVNAINLHL